MFRHTKEFNTSSRTIGNAKGSLSDRRKIIPNGNTDPFKEWKTLEMENK